MSIDAGFRPEGTCMQIQRFWLLDNLRGLASLSVVLFHYKHFFYSAPGVLSPTFNNSEQPFYFILSPLYDFGFDAVQLFFTLSGFVFFFVYYQSLGDGKVTGREFVIARFSRLYPLHFVTLLFVACGQYLSWRSTGQFFVYPFNDAFHFLLNVLFISGWGFQRGDSFNGPIWSVSIEIALYMLFFLYAKLFRIRSSRDLAMAIVTWLILLPVWRLAPQTISLFAHSALCFFIGGIAFLAWKRCATCKRALQIKLFFASLAWSAFGLVWFAVGEYRSALDFIAFPALVLSLAIAQSMFVDAGKRTCIIGDISYSSYLLHFPLQLLIVLVGQHIGAEIDFNRPSLFLSFPAALFICSACTYYYFERPIQFYLRARLSPGRTRASFLKKSA